MRIAIFSEVFLPKIDGIVNTLCHVLDFLAQRGDTSLVIAPEGAPSAYAGSRIISIPAAKLPIYPELKLANPWTNLDQQLDEFHPDLVHIVNPFALGIIGLRYARSRRIPLAASYHTDIPGFAARWGLGIFSESLRSYLRWIHNQADINLCPSRATQSELYQHGFKRLRIFTRGVDTARFSPQYAGPAMRQRLTGDQLCSHLLLYVGRLSAEKRIDWLKPVLQAAPGTHLAIVGDGPQREQLEGDFQGMPVTFMGYLRGTELSTAYASSDVFIFPAANETFGNVALEAMASGLPVIAPRSGGVLDFIEHGRNGLLFDCESQNSLVEQSLHLMNNPKLATQIAQAGLKTAAQRDWNAVLEGLMTQYADLIQRDRTRPLNKQRPSLSRRVGMNELP